MAIYDVMMVLINQNAHEHVVVAFYEKYLGTIQKAVTQILLALRSTRAANSCSTDACNKVPLKILKIQN